MSARCRETNGNLPDQEYDLEAAPLSIFYTNADYLQNKMNELRTPTADSSLGVIAFTETWDRQEIQDTELASTRYKLFRKDYADGRKGGGISILVKNAVAAVRRHLPDITHSDELASGRSPAHYPLILMCFYRHPLLSQWRPLFDDSFRFFVVGNLNASHADLSTLLFNAFSFAFDSKFLNIFPHVREPIGSHSDAPPPLPITFTKDDSDVCDSKFHDPLD